MWGKRIDFHAPPTDLIHVRQAVGKSESEFLGRRAAPVSNVVSAHCERRPARQIASAILNDVRRQFDPCFGRENISATGKILFEDVVLDEHARVADVHSLLLKGRNVHRRDDRTNRVSRGANLPNLFQGNTFEQAFHIGQRTDVHTRYTHFACSQRVIGVVTALSWEVKSNGEAGLAALQQSPIAVIGFLCRPIAGIHPHDPEIVAIHCWGDASGEWICAGIA